VAGVVRVARPDNTDSRRDAIRELVEQHSEHVAGGDHGITFGEGSGRPRSRAAATIRNAQVERIDSLR
jgi:hypothetical protein